MKSPDLAPSIVERWNKETAHLSPQERQRVLDVLLKANEARKKREAQTIAAQFHEDTKHLGPEGQKRVLEAISLAAKARAARLAGNVVPIKVTPIKGKAR